LWQIKALPILANWVMRMEPIKATAKNPVFPYFNMRCFRFFIKCLGQHGSKQTLCGENLPVFTGGTRKGNWRTH
jgi:hypothetical protein